MKSVFWKIEEFEELSSTNTALKEKADLLNEGQVYIAHRQTKGKGSKGRSFLSPYGGLYMSLLLKPKTKGFEGTGITALTASAMSEALEEVFGLKVGIKWVNDLILNGKKVGGILTEAKINTSGFEWVIVGIGVNLVEPEGGFSKEIANIAGAVKERCSNKEKLALINTFLDKFKRYYENFESGEYKKPYRERSCILGKCVTIKLPDEEITGKAVDIDELNRLVVDVNGNLKEFSSGEVVKVDYER